MSLVLPSESDVENSTLQSIENEEHGNDSIVKGKGKRLERSKSLCDDQSYLSMLWPVNQRVNSCEFFPASSFYPGRGDTTHVLAHPSLNQATYVFHTPQVDDDGSETEEDPMDDEPAADLSLKALNKFSESLVIEVSLLSSTSSTD
jgi:hypothetical protein